MLAWRLKLIYRNPTTAERPPHSKIQHSEGRNELLGKDNLTWYANKLHHTLSVRIKSMLHCPKLHNYSLPSIRGLQRTTEEQVNDTINKTDNNIDIVIIVLLSCYRANVVWCDLWLVCIPTLHKTGASVAQLRQSRDSWPPVGWRLVADSDRSLSRQRQHELTRRQVGHLGSIIRTILLSISIATGGWLNHSRVV